MFTTIQRDAVKERLDADEPVVLLEVLPEEEYAKTHLPGALHLPPDDVRALAPTLIPDRNTEVIVYCASESCDISKKAAELLDQMAYAQVRHYEGGKKDWIDAGLPTEPRS